MLTYRREIDGLRSVAVIPVVLFHAGVESFSGGYVGVDVFFVISGYLITSIILSEKQQGKFSLLGFYERRARRILPALFLVMFASLPFAWFYLMPSDFREFFKSVSYVPVFLQNFLFYRQSGYFDTAGELKPLLHTWSLAVEEQYYVFFPFLLLAAWRYGKPWVLALLSIVAILSFAHAQIAVKSEPAAAFFLFAGRMWELFIGAFIALYFSWNESAEKNLAQRGTLCQVGSAAGLALILYPVFRFDDHTPFPGLAALVPTLGAALIIIFSNPDTLVGRILGSRLLVSVGLISYSVYLWHQPLFAFARHKLTQPAPIVFAALIMAAIFLAYVSWRYVEKPFRDRQKIPRRRLAVILVSMSAFFIVIGQVGKRSDGFASRLNARQQELYAYKNYPSAEIYRQKKCFLDEGQTYIEFDQQCLPDREKSIILWGDSHAAALSSGLRDIAGNVAQMTSSGCPPLIGPAVSRQVNCSATNDFVLATIRNTRPSVVVLHANWILYGKVELATVLAHTIRAVKQAAPDTRIVLLGGVPQWHPSLPEVLIRQGREEFLSGSGSLANPELDRLSARDQLISDVARQNDALYVSARDGFCRGAYCSVSTDYNGRAELVMWDYGHLTSAGSRLLASYFLPFLGNVIH